MQKIEELRGGLSAARLAVEAGEKSISDFTLKAERLQETIPGLQAEADRLQQQKSEMLQAVVMDGASEADLQKIRKRAKDAGEKVAETEELLSAILDAKGKAESDLPRLQSKLAGARHELFYHIKILECEKARAAAASFITRAWVSGNMAGGGGEYGNLLQTIFPHPGLDNGEVAKALWKEYCE